MGIMETKIIQVDNDPRVINAANEEWGRWGWSVLNVQVTHSQNTEEYQDWTQYGTNEVTVKTTTINYATITYQRDKGMPNYERIVALEAEYDTVEDRIHSSMKNNDEQLPDVVEYKFGGREWAIAIFLFYLYIIPGVIYIIHKRKQKKASQTPENLEKKRIREEMLSRRNNAYENERKLIQQEKNRILSEAAALLRSA